MRTNGFEYKPCWEFYTDWGRYPSQIGVSELDLGNFTIFCIDVNFEASYFTFHLALLGVHVGRSIGIK